MANYLFIVKDIALPVIAGVIFFGLAVYVTIIGSLRELVIGKETYQRAFIGFISFGLYLATRPVQILLGPHPIPLIVNNIREFFMIGIFSPSIFIALFGLSYTAKAITKILRVVIYSLCLFCAIVFVVTNIYAIGGSEEIFRLGKLVAYDGLWFKNLTPERAKLMGILFLMRLTSPVLVFFVIASIALYRAVTYPESEKRVYSNMPKKLIFSAIGTYCFSLSMLTVGFVWLLGKIPNQWWGYYVGALLAGLFETISISLPLRKEKVFIT